MGKAISLNFILKPKSTLYCEKKEGVFIGSLLKFLMFNRAWFKEPLELYMSENLLLGLLSDDGSNMPIKCELLLLFNNDRRHTLLFLHEKI